MMKKIETPTRQRLLAVGLDIAKTQGLNAVTIRGVSKQANINLGSFVYHFGTREAFLREIVENWYAPLFETLQIQQTKTDSPIVNLRNMMLQVTAFVCENRIFISQLLMDTLLNESVVREQVQTIFPRHIQLLLSMIKKAQDAKQICQAEPMHIFVFLGHAVGLPIILQELFFKSNTETVPEPQDISSLTSCNSMLSNNISANSESKLDLNANRIELHNKSDDARGSSINLALVSAQLIHFSVTPEHIAQRIDWVLKGVQYVEPQNKVDEIIIDEG